MKSWKMLYDEGGKVETCFVIAPDGWTVSRVIRTFRNVAGKEGAILAETAPSDSIPTYDLSPK